jgi:thiamine kinase-like enzyme
MEWDQWVLHLMGCRGKMKKTMKMGISKSGGDDYFNRLLSYFKQQFNEPIIKMEQIRDSVYIVKTMTKKYVVKGYSKYKKLKLQETFTRTLHQEGFHKTYQYFQDITKESLFFEGEYFGCMEYLSPHHRPFTFDSHKNRKEGLKLLEEFHQVTASCVIRYKTLLSYSDMLEKYSERLKTFKKYHSKITYFLNEQTVNELIDWADWSLNGMKENESFFFKQPSVILHGDVAHHNFLRDKNGLLNLIDFDLIHIGPASIDYLQYANRILPSIDWSIDKLSQYRQMGELIKDKAFLYALAFPTDIFREWNRIMREKKYTKHYYSDYVIDLTLEQLDLRRKFVEEIKMLLEKM